MKTHYDKFYFYFDLSPIYRRNKINIKQYKNMCNMDLCPKNYHPNDSYKVKLFIVKGFKLLN